MRHVAMIVAVLVCLTGCYQGPLMADDPSAIQAFIVHHGEPAFNQLAREFQQKTGIRVHATYACRGPMPGVIQKAGGGDLCITNGQKHLDRLKEEGLSKGAPVRIGDVTPIIQVMKGNPKKIASLADLARPGVRVVLCIPQGCIGRVSDEILSKNGLAEKVEKNVVRRVRGEHAVATSVDGKDVDACIVWSWTTMEVGPDKYHMVPIPAKANVIDPMAAVLLKTAKHEAAAKQFITFLQTERAQKVLADAELKTRE
ncbi:extracellular solute-binding protein [bacterium]|nr:extracellular solute-binding protein [bacterium]